MRIQHNIASLNSYRNYTNNTNAVSKNLEKLSSGYRINRAGDDAAGLAISEKMRAQITGLETAQKNAADGVSLVQTAEGALTEVHSMLNRMVELADQSANGTYDNTVDRANLQKEIKDLKAEIDRIADGTNFNGINLLDGTLGGKGNIAGKLGIESSKVTISKTESAALKNAKGDVKKGDTVSYTVSWKDGDVEKSKTIKLTVTNEDKNGKAVLTAEDGTEYEATKQATGDELAQAFLSEMKKDSGLSNAFDISANAGVLSFTSKQAGTAGATITALQASGTGQLDSAAGGGGIDATKTKVGKDAQQILDFTGVSVLDAKGANVPTAEDIEKAIFEVDGKKFVLAAKDSVTTNFSNIPSDVTVITLKNGDTYSPQHDAASVAAEIGRVTGKEFEVAQAADADAGIVQHDIIFKGKETLSKDGQSLTLQIGDTSADYNQLEVAIKDCHVATLGIADIDIGTQAGAKAAVDVIKNAINYVSDVRGTLGATQNRLEHTINNLSVTTENMTAAESRIRDVDVAKEMMSYTKNNILVQSAQAMLAQANQTPQGVLQLLQ